jgi:hypothetical protein
MTNFVPNNSFDPDDQMNFWPGSRDRSASRFFKKIILFSKLERLKFLKIVILSFNDDSELGVTLEKLQTLKWENKPSRDFCHWQGSQGQTFGRRRA